MKFDAYEFIAVIIPGALPTLTAALLIPEVAHILKSDGIDLGGFGVFLIVSYVIGHAVQVIGNGIEKIEDMIGFGMIDMAVKPERRPVDAGQWDKFLKNIDKCGLGSSSEPTNATWPSIRREVYAHLSSTGRTQRIDTFNRIYGLCRGMVAGTLATAGIIILLESFEHKQNLLISVLILSFLLYVRMRRFSAHYFKELISQFTSIKTEASLP